MVERKQNVRQIRATNGVEVRATRAQDGGVGIEFFFISIGTNNDFYVWEMEFEVS